VTPWDSPLGIVSRFGGASQRWEVKPLKRCVHFVEGPGIMASDFADEGVPLLRIRGIGGRTATLDGCNFLQPDQVERKWAHFRAQAGDLLISGSASTGLCSEVDESTAGAIPYTGIIIVRPSNDQIDRDFFRWFFLSDQFALQVAVAQTGTAIQHFGPTHLAAMFVSVPPLPKQRAIADYLDRETARLDALVAAKERVLGLLAEKRRALITRAVTRGLDDEAPLKDTGVEWLPQAPRHWISTKIRRLFRQAKRLGFPDLTVLSVYRDYGVIGRASRDDNANRVPDDLEKYQLVEVDDLVINKMKAWQGSLGISGLLGITSPDYVVFCPLHREDPRFLHFLLRNHRLTTVYLSMSNGIRTSQWRIEPDRFEDLGLVLPPLGEQRAIVAYIHAKSAKLDALRLATERTIALLKERRAALIAAAVTGKIEAEGTAWTV
jgi:type I restriction enzyme S subunit